MNSRSSSPIGVAVCVLLVAAARTANAEPAASAGDTGWAGTAPASERTPARALHDPGSVHVVIEGAESPLLLEAAIRIEAELRAAHFQVSSNATEGETGSELRLSVEGSSVRIEARAASGGGEIVQRVNQAGRAGSAEVIAVRAVESLRAALLLALRDGTLDEQSVGVDVRHFVGLEEPEQELEPEIEPAPVPAPEPSLRPERASSSKPPPWMVTLGPLAASWGGGAPVNAGAEATLRFRTRWWSLGVLVDGAFAGGQLHVAEGTVRLQSLSVLGRPALELPLGQNSGASLGAGLGLHELWMLPSLTTGTELDSVTHAAFLAQFDAELHAFFGQFGLYARGRVGALTDSPTITPNDTTLGRPVWSAGVGLAGRFGAGSTGQ